MTRMLSALGWALLLLAAGAREGRAQVSDEYEQLVARLVAVETLLAAWEGERDDRYGASMAERASLEAAVRAATEAHLTPTTSPRRKDLESRLRTERDLGLLGRHAGPEGLGPPDRETETGLGPPDLPGPPPAAQKGLEIAKDARERGRQTAEEARRRAAEIAEDARQRGRDVAEEARARARENADDARDRARDIAEDARDRARDAADDARRGAPGPP